MKQFNDFTEKAKQFYLNKSIKQLIEERDSYSYALTQTNPRMLSTMNVYIKSINVINEVIEFKRNK